MKTRYSVTFILFVLVSIHSSAQEIKTLFGKDGHSTGGYGALSNKFTTLGGEFANVSEIYGGVFIGNSVMVGLALAGSTNDIRVPVAYSISPNNRPMTYQYGQGGLKMEYVVASNNTVHLVLNAFGGAGFTLQYDRNGDGPDHRHDVDLPLQEPSWFYVVEPGAQVEVNLLRWLRLSPGVSYRKVYGSTVAGLSNADLSDWSYNMTLKIGNFGKGKKQNENSKN